MAETLVTLERLLGDLAALRGMLVTEAVAPRPTTQDDVHALM
jgi:hypothetical protein